MGYLCNTVMAAFIIAMLLSLIPNANADEAWLGLRTYHFDRTPSGCRDETHHLYAYRKGDYHVGTYSNSQCKRSYLVGYSHELGSGFGVDVSAVTGYPSAMHVVDGLVLIPQLTYTAFYGSIGAKLIYVPTVLVGVGVAVKF